MSTSLFPAEPEPPPFTHHVREAAWGHWQVCEPGGTWVCTCRNKATAVRVAALLDEDAARRPGSVAAPAG